MELSDRLKQLVSGRSEAIERAVDAALGQVGRYSETLQRQAEVVKDKVRSLDETRVASPDAAAPAEAAPAAPAPAPPTPPGGSALRGDLVEERPEPPDP